MDIEESLPAGWTLWSHERTRIVLVYRPDVFDSEAYPAACLPTLYLSKGQRDRRPGRDRAHPDDPWFVTLSLEPDVTGTRQRYDDREAAIDGALDLAAAFAAGEYDYRGLYQVPRDAYLDRLDELTGRET
ncbi:MAG: DUF5820 family protein [Halapricum sp.]